MAGPKLWNQMSREIQRVHIGGLSAIIWGVIIGGFIVLALDPSIVGLFSGLVGMISWWLGFLLRDNLK